MKSILKFVKSQPVLVIAGVLAIITLFIIPPDKEYLGYCNTSVLIELFSLMIAVAGFRSVGVFDATTSLLLKKAGTVRRLGLILTLICFFTSMLVTNDVALLTFVPLTIMLFSSVNDEKARILVIVLETCAANIGSMMTPFGNPQNLYIYDEFRLSGVEFLTSTLPYGLTGLVILAVLTLSLPKTRCSAPAAEKTDIPKEKAVGYAVLFIVCLLTVFRVIPSLVCLAATVVCALIFDRKLLLKADYALIATFVCFFVFVGNIARIDAVSGYLSSVLVGREVWIAALLSQGISNVPAAVMLSGFTENGKGLLVGVNIGGLGTLIASLASLISFQFYRKSAGAKTGKYFGVFSAVNFGILALLLVISFILN